MVKKRPGTNLRLSGFDSGQHFADQISRTNTVCRSRTWYSFAVLALLSVHAALLVVGAIVHSPTLDEPAHLVAGVCNWQFGNFTVYKVNPPLVRLVAAIPVLLSGVETDWQGLNESPESRLEFPLGEQFVRTNGARSLFLTTVARWACIPFSLLGGWMCSRWARALW